MAHEPASARTARRWVTAAVSEAGLDPDIVDDAALVVSELVTNAVRHAEPLPGGVIEISVAVLTTAPTPVVQLRVTDGGGPTLPALVRMPADEPVVNPHSGGRGLSIVSTVVQQWGVEVDPKGPTTVWAQISPRGRHHHRSGRPA